MSLVPWLRSWFPCSRGKVPLRPFAAALLLVLVGLPLSVDTIVTRLAGFAHAFSIWLRLIVAMLAAMLFVATFPILFKGHPWFSGYESILLRGKSVQVSQVSQVPERLTAAFRAAFDRIFAKIAADAARILTTVFERLLREWSDGIVAT